jgi:hypothetical protein
MKIYKIRKRINNPLQARNAVGWKNPFYEASVNDKPLVSRMVDPERDSKKRGVVFAYGYHGLFPANLAVSLLCDFLELEDYSELFSETGYGKLANKFYEDFICENTEPSWQITEDQLWQYASKVVEDLESEVSDYEKV